MYEVVEVKSYEIVEIGKQYESPIVKDISNIDTAQTLCNGINKALVLAEAKNAAKAKE